MSAVCGLCFHRCRLRVGQRGLCGARGNVDGRIRCLNYGLISSLALDPIEKKPLSRFHPGSAVLSVGSVGCNLRCAFCQNHEISMAAADWESPRTEPRALVERALSLRERGNIGLAYTYNEPLIGYEFVRDCATLVHRQGMYNILVSNGTIEEEPWQRLLPLIDAANIDLKGFRGDYYRRLGGDLETVKRSIVMAAKQCHLEVTTLIVPGENDSVEEMRALSAWLASVDPNIPLHISRFFPRYRMRDAVPTPPETIHALVGEARRVLRYVYAGNL